MSRQNRMNLSLAMALLATGICAAITRAEIVEYDEKDEWEAAAGSWSTADFTGFPDDTLITEQYAYLGVHFVDGWDFVVLGNGFINDGAGLDGNQVIDLVFDAPMYSIAADFPGTLTIDLYYEGDFFYRSNYFGGSGIGWFGGLVSTEPFDRALIWDFDEQVNLDDLHFGPPIPAPSALCILSAALLRACRRRER
ncbi:MAG: hypothetical protein SYC29_11895 [Planctomycetota bacterium]|nr:hypothetical protein [Planctomycetota bacterium]